MGAGASALGLSSETRDALATLPQFAQDELALLTPRPAAQEAVPLHQPSAVDEEQPSAVDEAQPAQPSAVAAPVRPSVVDAAATLGYDAAAAAALQASLAGEGRPPHFGSEALLQSVASGAIAPLRGRWIVEQAKRGPLARRRQAHVA